MLVWHGTPLEITKKEVQKIYIYRETHSKHQARQYRNWKPQTVWASMQKIRTKKIKYNKKVCNVITLEKTRAMCSRCGQCWGRQPLHVQNFAQGYHSIRVRSGVCPGDEERVPATKRLLYHPYYVSPIYIISPDRSIFAKYHKQTTGVFVQWLITRKTQILLSNIDASWNPRTEE